MKQKFFLLLIALLAPTACVTVKPVVVDEKTQLENQILGHFERLEKDLILASAVRGPSSTPTSQPVTTLVEENQLAMQRREFRRDDVDAFKQSQVIGENKEGDLAVLKSSTDKERDQEIATLVAEENQDRLILMRRVISIDPQLSDIDLPKVRRIFARLQAQTANPGDLVETSDGLWKPQKAN